MRARLGVALVAIGLASCHPAATCGRTPVLSRKVAEVDLRRTLNETQEGKAAKAELEEHKRGLQRPLDERKAALQGQIEDFQRRRAGLPRAEASEREARLREELASLERQYDVSQRDLGAHEEKLRARIYDRAVPIIESISERDGYGLVIERQQRQAICPLDTAVAADVVANKDITDEVIRRLDAAPGH